MSSSVEDLLEKLEPYAYGPFTSTKALEKKISGRQNKGQKVRGIAIIYPGAAIRREKDGSIHLEYASGKNTNHPVWKVKIADNGEYLVEYQPENFPGEPPPRWKEVENP